MRGADVFTEQSYTIKNREDFVPASHPLRLIRERVNAALEQLNRLFQKMGETVWVSISQT